METKVGLCKSIAHFTQGKETVEDEDVVEHTQWPNLGF